MTWSEGEKKDRKPWANVPEGSHVATCIDVVDMGIPDWTKKADNPTGTHKVKLVFHARVTDENGNPLENPNGQAWTCDQMFSMYFSEKALLRQFVENWLGRKLDKAEARAFNEESLVGKDAIISVVWSEPRTGIDGEPKVYANVKSASKPLPGMKGPGIPPDYVRVKDRPAKQQWNKKPLPTEDIGF